MSFGRRRAITTLPLPPPPQTPADRPSVSTTHRRRRQTLCAAIARVAVDVYKSPRASESCPPAQQSGVRAALRGMCAYSPQGTGSGQCRCAAPPAMFCDVTGRAMSDVLWAAAERRPVLNVCQTVWSPANR